MSVSPLRNASFDYARCVAVIGIVWFHSHAPYGDIGYSGLAFFLILLPFVGIPYAASLRSARHRAPAFLRYAALRGRRLITPWLGACVLYGALKLVDVMRGAAWGAEFNSTMWLTGPALHLWFLPFAFVIALVLWPLARWMRMMKRTTQVNLCMTFMCLSLLSLAFWQTAQLPTPLAQWAHAMPAVLLGVAFALTGGTLWRMIGVGAVFFTMALSANWTIGLMQLGIASGVLIACAALKTKPTAISGLAARTSLGIYLVHPAVAAVCARSGLIAEQSTTFATAVTLGSLAIVIGCETIRATAPRLKHPSKQEIRLPANSP